MKPFLQWPGGKARVAPLLLPHFKLPCRRFIEPFCGAASVSLAVAGQGGAEKFWLNDINRDLVNCLSTAAITPEEFINLALQIYNDEHNTPEAYYKIRAEFNTAGYRLTSNQAARFLYLNRHCFNALVRFNSRGEFNAPYRKDKRISAFPAKEIRGFSRLMAHAWFTFKDFESVISEAGPGDVVYCDPPYIPLSATANFTDYAPGGFGMADQIRLFNAARQAAERGARVVISNSDTPVTRELYAGAEIHPIQVHRSISCKGDGRGKVGEIIAVFTPPDAPGLPRTDDLGADVKLY